MVSERVKIALLYKLAAMKIISKANILAITTTSILTAGASAGKLLEEQFSGGEYTIGGSISGKTGGTGFGSGWTITTAGSSTATVAAGLGFSDFAASGNALTINIAQTGFGGLITVSRDVGDSSAPAIGGELWASYLYRNNSGGTGGDDSRMQFTEPNGSNARFLLTSRDDAAELNGGVGVDNSDEGGTSNRSLQDGSIFLLIAKFTNFGAGSAATPQNGRFWALRPSDYDLIKSGGITEAELDTNFYSRGNDNPVTSPISYSTANLFGISGTIGVASGAYNYTVDELRYGTLLTDVVPIPEPSSLCLLGLGGALLARQRRTT